MSPTVLNNRSSRISLWKALKSHAGLVFSVVNPTFSSTSSACGADSGATNKSMSLEQRGRPSAAEASPPIRT